MKITLHFYISGFFPGCTFSRDPLKMLHTAPAILLDNVIASASWAYVRTKLACNAVII